MVYNFHLKGLRQVFGLTFFMYEMVNLRILNGWPKFVCYITSQVIGEYKDIPHCYVNKARV